MPVPTKSPIPCTGIRLIPQLVLFSMDWFPRRSEECQCQTKEKDGSVGARRGNGRRNAPWYNSWALDYVGCEMECMLTSMTCFSHVSWICHTGQLQLQGIKDKLSAAQTAAMRDFFFFPGLALSI